jgi:hypothetical protein
MHPSNAPAAQLKDEAKFWLAYSLIPLFPYSLIPLFPYSLIPLFPYSLIPLFPYSLIPLFFVFASNEAETDLTLNCEQFR